MGGHERRTSLPVHAAALLAAVLACLSAAVAEAQAPLRKIGEMELSLLGVSATVDPLAPVVPKNIASAVRIVVRAGTTELSVPMLLQPEEEAGPGAGPPPKLELPSGGGSFSIPALLVIPGDVGFLKQFFSAQLFVANGAPVGSGLVVRDVTGTVNLPLGPDGVRGRDPDNCTDPQRPETCLNDDPLSLPDLVRDGVSSPHPETLPVTQVGPDGAPGTPDDEGNLRPAEQGMADFTIRGDKEGFHRISFDIRAELLGLPVGAVRIKGKANGGVLVQNAKFKLSFVAPSVVRADEEFTLNVAVTNVSESAAANLLTLTLPADQISGAELPADESATRQIDTLGPQETAIFEYRLLSRATGQVVASYLSFSSGAATGELRFKVGVGERGVPLSPDTLALPTSVAGLPPTVVRAAMRVLGNAWSVANAPSGALPKDVVRTDRTVVTQKALALAEAGLRVTLGQPALEAVRDLGYDFWSGTPSFDPGFDQVLRTTRAGLDLARAIGLALEPEASASGPLEYERERAQVLASGPDFVSFAVAGAAGGRPPADVMLTDGLGRRTLSAGTPIPPAAVPTTVLVPLGDPADAPLLGLVTSPGAAPYHLTLLATVPGYGSGRDCEYR
jgi:hypothetical protein